MRTRLAKLTRPDTAGLLARERLFTLLDDARSGRFAWVSAAGGEGKTSLVSTWVVQRGHNVLWYRIDGADRDPATFFHYLGVAAGSTARRKTPLPHFTPEYLAGLRDFTRRFFRAFFARLRTPCAVVFDNCHEVPADSPLENIIAGAVDEAPDGVVVIAISRKEPGKAFARWMTDARFVHVTTTDLRLTREEAQDIAAARGQREGDVSPLVAKVDGWAAGLVLLLRARRRDLAAADFVTHAQTAIFDYFTREILAAADARLRQFLLRASVLPILSPSLAQRLTGFGDATQLLAGLHRDHFFTERRSRTGDEVLYEFHPLFREFLLNEARRESGTDAFAAHCRQAAALLEEDGRHEMAVPLRIMSGDWPALVRLVCSSATELMRQGRWQTLQGWINAAPSEVVESQPWLRFWRGTCQCMMNPALGRADLEAAYREFRQGGDSIGALLACAGILDAGYLELGDQKSSVPWVDEIDHLLAASPPLPLDIEARVLQALMGAWMAQPQHPIVARGAARAAELVRNATDVTGVARLVSIAIAYYVWAGDFATARDLVDRVALDRRLIETTPLTAITMCLLRSGVYWQGAEHDDAYAMRELAQRIADDSAVHVLDGFIAFQGIYIATSAGDLARAQHELARLRALLDPRRRLEFSQYRVLAASVDVLAGRTAEALQTVGRELAPQEEIGAPFVTATTRVQYAQILVLNGRHAEAHEPLRAALAFALAMPSWIMQFHSLLASAWAHLRGGDEHAAVGALRAGLAVGRERNYLNCHPLWIPDMMRELFALALSEDIETDYVRRFVRHRRLAGSLDDEHWPWPIRVHTLGRFEIRRDDIALSWNGKAKQRVLDLLKVVIASGPHGASLDHVAEALWPDAEGDAGRDALRVALHRLRKLLGDEQAVIVHEGMIRCNPQWCWIDAFAFERTVDAASGKPVCETLLLELYRGHFLAADGDRAWLMAERERLRSKFIRAVESAGAALVQVGERERAIDLYRRATEIDPLAEALYRRLIDCYVRENRIAEGVEAYRRCRQMLSIVLGARPAPETETLHVELLNRLRHAG